ncbi:MAG: hypothetical protein JW909_13075 [Planctomycetes bacterium]|nr:hypothetical protein [Planctomycetota bacterium]
MTDDAVPDEPPRDEEKIPRKVRDLIGRMGARIEKLETALAETGRTDDAPGPEPSAPEERSDPGSAPAGGGRPGGTPHVRPTLAEELRRAAEAAGLPPEIFDDIDAVIDGPSGPGPAVPGKALAPAGASSMPSAPPPQEDPDRAAARRAESVVSHLDERFFGSE